MLTCQLKSINLLNAIEGWFLRRVVIPHFEGRKGGTELCEARFEEYARYTT